MRNRITALRTVLVPATCILIAHANPTAASGIEIQEKTTEKRSLGSFKFLFHYQSQGVTYSEWITLLTLCLAPVVVHLIANVPESVVLDGNPPRFIDYLCHYNPTSVMWRYFTIIDARVRCRHWTPEDMAAANAHFWTRGSWESSQKMRIQQRARLHMPPRAYNAPARTYIDPLSGSAIKTVIATLQGAQAMYALISSRSPHNVYLWDLSLASIFQPFAILGLLRLPAAPWISEQYIYDYRPTKGPHQHRRDTDLVPTNIQDVHSPNENDVVSRNFYPASSIRGVLIRAFYFLAMLALAIWTSTNPFPDSATDKPVTITGYMHAVFYAFFLDVTVLIFAFYLFTGKSTTTVIPCVQQTWYTVYTIVVFLGMVTFMVLAALQTRKTWCGTWTTFPVMWEWGVLDWEPCPVDCGRLAIVGKVLGEGSCSA
ncbi:hypothetical protein DM02DRAFT_592144 [Periconia macrospinosa]|uniref:Uncharacterized protein n=1 Tax=Periconia macrospinosa TaxID=97972 RepID=A0A2V1DRU6_9PLEO|nr:hypothetical protein DM02DRAFT_592144 [Periconia macrospinosa]